MSNTSDVLIIGAGIIGCAVGLELSQRGYRVAQVDRLAEAGLGSTSSSCAIVRAHYSTYIGVALAYECFHYWRDWAGYAGAHDERGLARFINCGSVMIKSPGHKWEQIARLYQEVGVEHEHWTTAQLRERLPILRTAAFYPPARPDDPAFWREPEGELLGAIFTPGAGYVSDPALAAHNLQRAAEARGVRYHFNQDVVAVRQAGGRVQGVTLASGERLDAPIVVNVSGPHSFVINRLAGVEAGMRIKTRALRHEVHLVPAPAGFDFEHNGTHVSDGDTGVYIRPEAGNTILVGSGDPACDAREWVDDPDHYDDQVSEAQWKAQVYRLAKRMPSLGIPNERKGLVSLYDVADDWIPIYDRSDLGGFYLAVGTSGNQFKNAGPVGRLMAELIGRCEAGHDHDAQPVTVTGRYTGLKFDLGAFSRRRAVNTASSFTVSG